MCCVCVACPAYPAYPAWPACPACPTCPACVLRVCCVSVACLLRVACVACVLRMCCHSCVCCVCAACAASVACCVWRVYTLATSLIIYSLTSPHSATNLPLFQHPPHHPLRMKLAQKDKENEKEKKEKEKEGVKKKVISLPRGGIVINTKTGPVQVGMPPETIKDSMALGIQVPGYLKKRGGERERGREEGGRRG